ncbi:hypothetical protein [Mycobacterium hubeiense]|uniref:hypothetical protein n=1 Tax=Mycobacterium hubeiense TaxID=1867256 RepID=UPI0027D1F74B|nr:hypothetical protein [Mycobacterium sp. QGD 101]
MSKIVCPGWTERQLPDGTIEFTAPTGQLPTPTVEESGAYHDVMMPKRTQTREQHRQDRSNQPRRGREELIAEEERQRQAWLAANYQPPPF